MTLFLVLQLGVWASYIPMFWYESQSSEDLPRFLVYLLREKVLLSCIFGWFGFHLLVCLALSFRDWIANRKSTRQSQRQLDIQAAEIPSRIDPVCECRVPATSSRHRSYLRHITQSEPPRGMSLRYGQWGSRPSRRFSIASSAGDAMYDHPTRKTF